ncbi:hypothetical protein ERO13_A02G009750v2 [Gossypium hirsutum]|nr:hypothetical protein ERO13_A02G009750v2 [Gossypium hirsutum]
MKVRSMLPMSIRCNACGNYICEGTKFNFRKEDVIGETYKGIRMHRFYFKCTKCSAEMTIKTDPQDKNYVAELGARINFEPWRAEDEEVEKEKQKRKSQGMEKENKIEEALVKSIFQKPKEAVPRITYEDSTLLSSGNDGLKRRKEGPSGSGSRLVKAPSKPSVIIFLLKQKPEKKQEETGLLSLQQNYAESGD